MPAMTTTLLSAAERANASFEHIPIINLSAYTKTTVDNTNLENEQARKRELAKEIREACLTAGFFYVKDHGIPEETIHRVMAAAETFFFLTEESKLKIRNQTTPSNFKGYTPIKNANNDPNGDGDMHEGFLVGWEAHSSTQSNGLSNSGVEGSDSAKASEDIIGKNSWPLEDEVPGFREAVLGYYHAVVGLGKSLFPLFALALDLPEDFFVDKTRNSAALMRLLHYPPQVGPVDDRVIGIGAHTDWECFTILWQQPDIQALQVLSPQDKKWIDAPPIPATLVINLGDQFARWTNGIFKSNVHRAINRSGVERYSIPLFFGTDYDVLLEPIPSCVSNDRPPRYEAISAGEYIQSRLKDTYS